jgi:hypothetical protein
MTVPYNTGKVLIGCNYQKPQYVEEDADMLLLQSHLIYCPRTIRRYIWERRVVKVSTMVAALVILVSWLLQ